MELRDEKDRQIVDVDGVMYHWPEPEPLVQDDRVWIVDPETQTPVEATADWLSIMDELEPDTVTYPVLGVVWEPQEYDQLGDDFEDRDRIDTLVELVKAQQKQIDALTMQVRLMEDAQIRAEHPVCFDEEE